MIRQEIVAWCLPWHVEKSPAAKRLLVESLEPYAKVELRGWDGQHLPALANAQEQNTEVFFQLPPPPDRLNAPNARLVWIPMWDSAHGLENGWWKGLPNSLRIVAFSRKIVEKAKGTQASVYYAQYFTDNTCAKFANWDRGRVLFYWNRTGLVSRQILVRLSKRLQISKLIFRGMLDPGCEAAAAYSAPNSWSGVEVQRMSDTWDAVDYEQVMEESNVMIAPRVVEGVGLTFLEAMARGCAVIAYDGATMNEYIRHGENGILLRPPRECAFRRFIRSIPMGRRFGWSRLFEPAYRHPLAKGVDWRGLANLDLQALGNQARRDSEQGHAAWIKQIPAYADFVLKG